jgi:signal transduction histidine kinase/AraC-like DNA-binding protein
MLPQSQMLTLLEQNLAVICSDETPLRHPLLVSPQGLYDAAALATEYLAQKLNQHGHILLVGGPEQNPYTARVRLNGFRDTMQRYPDLRYTRIPTLWRYEEVYAQLTEDLHLWQAEIGAGAVDAIFGLSDSIALAARDAGRRLGFVDDRTLIVGINGDPLAVAAILHGAMHASVETSAHDFGCRLVDLGASAARGEPLPATFPYRIELIAPQNAVEVAARKLVDIAALPSRLVDVYVQQERQRLKQMETSLELNRHIGSILDKDELLRTLADIIRSRYAYDRVQLLLWEPAEQRLVLAQPYGATAERTTVELDAAGPLGDALLRNRALYIPDARNSQRFAPDPHWPDLRTRVIAPIRIGGRTLGLLDLHSRSRTARSQTEIDALQMLADQVGSAMQNVQRYATALENTLAAERSSQMKSRLLATLSHELRGPLNVILGYSQAALAESNPYGAPLPAELQDDLRYIEQSGEDLLRLINSMLDLAQAETGMLPLYPATIATHDFLTRVFTDARRIAAPVEAVSWRLQLPQDLPPLLADPVRVRNALLNVLDSAGKSTERGQIVMSAQASATHLLITIQDTGRGIDRPRLARIRNGVTGDAAAPADEADLTDLGWRLALHIVALHGGEFTVDSEPGRGVACRVALPLAAMDKGGEAGAANLTVAHGSVAAAARQLVGQGDLALVQKAHDFVAAQYVTPFTRGDLARVLGVSEAYVSRVFRRVTGCSLWEYVNHYRIQCACELLERTAMSVTEIALAVGYNEPSYFSRIFRSETGRSPQTYRKRPVATPLPAPSPASTREPV